MSDTKHEAKPKKREVLFLVPVGETFSGQMGAALMLRKMLESEGFRTKLVEIPVLDRGEDSGWLALPVYCWRYLKAFVKTPLHALSSPFVYITPGQTRISSLRDFPLFFMASVISRNWTAAAIHGSLFMEWKNVRGTRGLFMALLRRADCVTVLGQGQYEKLASFGLSPIKMLIVPNPTDMPPLSAEEIAAKHAAPGVVRILYLSLLLDSKGYPEYLEALLRLSRDKLPRKIEAVLCGPLVGNALSDRFHNLHEAREWIEKMVGEINASESVKVRWVEGAWGEEKRKLMEAAHLFVLPSRYRNEAQPLSIIEAMASGAAVITTKVGEIPGSFGDCAALIDSMDSDQIAATMRTLVLDDRARLELAHAGRDRYADTYSPQKHLDKWLHIFAE